MRREYDAAEEEIVQEEDPRVIEIIEEMIERVRNILDLFEGLVHEVYHLGQALADIFRQLKEILGWGDRDAEEELEGA